MQITKDKVATFEFTVTNAQGEVLDSSARSGPFPYIHGIGYLIPGLEAAMQGKSAGDKFKVAIPPAEAYGERDKSLLMILPKSKFQGIDDLEVGTRIQVGHQNQTRIMEVTDITDDNVTLDGNHPLAGMLLNFEVSVVDVRDATPEELAHGHPIIEGCTDDCDCQDESHGGGCGCGCE